MTRIWVSLDANGRIGAWTTHELYSARMTEVSTEDDFETSGKTPSDYVYADGALVYDPLPEPEPQPSVDERLDAVESGMAALTSAFDVEVANG